MLFRCEVSLVSHHLRAEAAALYRLLGRHVDTTQSERRGTTLVVHMSQLLPMVRLHGLRIVAQLLVSVLHEQQGGGGLDRAVVMEVEVNRPDTREPPRLVPYEGGDPSLLRRHYSPLPELRLERRV